MLISPLGLINMDKKQKNFEVKMRQRGLLNMQKKIIYWPPFWNKMYSDIHRLDSIIQPLNNCGQNVNPLSVNFAIFVFI